MLTKLHCTKGRCPADISMRRIATLMPTQEGFKKARLRSSAWRPAYPFQALSYGPHLDLPVGAAVLRTRDREVRDSRETAYRQFWQVQLLPILEPRGSWTWLSDAG